VGGSENTAEDVDTGNVKPELLSAENLHVESGLSTDIDGKIRLVPDG
jgi:hypothetical protein